MTMNRREKLQRIIGHYELPCARGRCVRDIVAHQPLEWFTDEQLEFIASRLVSDARFSTRLNRQNRERMNRSDYHMKRVHYDGKDGILEVKGGSFGYYAKFTADDIDTPGVRFVTFGNGHETPEDAMAAAVRGGAQPIKD